MVISPPVTGRRSVLREQRGDAVRDGCCTRCEVADFCHHSDLRKAAYDFTAAAKSVVSAADRDMIERSDTGAPFLPAHLCWASRWSRDGESVASRWPRAFEIAGIGDHLRTSCARFLT